MRQFRTLSKIKTDTDKGVMYILGEKGTHDYPSLMVKREGEYVPVSVSYGPIELALRLRHEELSRTLLRLQPVDGLITTRQVGSTRAYLGLGFRNDQSLLLRPTVVSDAIGYLSFNLCLPSNVRQQLYTWIDVQIPA